MNCLQNLLSLRSETTQLPLRHSTVLLWIAYKIYYLCDRKQLCIGARPRYASCELLTKFIIFAIGNNTNSFLCSILTVVNCLQNLLSLRSETTVSTNLSLSDKLWIAYKIYYLCDRKQPKLLYKDTAAKLWIAYKIYYLCDRKQPIYSLRFQFFRCELLTKFIIFAIGNNVGLFNRANV